MEFKFGLKFKLYVFACIFCVGAFYFAAQAPIMKYEQEYATAQEDYNTGDYDSAQEHLENALKAAPYSYKALCLMASAHIAQEDYTNAEAYLSKAIKARSDNWQALTILADVYKGNNENKKAIETYELALKSKTIPEDQRKTAQAALDALKSGVFSGTLASVPVSEAQNNETQSRQAYVQGLDAYNSGNYSLAIERFQLAIQYDPTLYRAHCLLALSYKATGNLPAAKGCLDKAIALNSSDYLAYVYYGDLSLAQGEYATARRYYEIALAITSIPIDFKTHCENSISAINQKIKAETPPPQPS